MTTKELMYLLFVDNNEFYHKYDIVFSNKRVILFITNCKAEIIEAINAISSDFSIKTTGKSVLVFRKYGSL